jgi:hypothetical protein
MARQGDEPTGQGSGMGLSVLVGPKKGHCLMLCGGAADHHLVNRRGCLQFWDASAILV